MSESTEWLKSEGWREIERFFIDRRLQVSSDGLPANCRITLDRPGKDTYFYQSAVRAIGEWVLESGVTILTAVPNIATRYAADVADIFEIPFAGWRKRRGGKFIPGINLRSGHEQLRHDSGAVGVVGDVLATGNTLLRFVENIKSPKPMTGLVIVDRGQDVEDILTDDEAMAYMREHPNLPPPHIDLPFVCEALIDHPLALYQT